MIMNTDQEELYTESVKAGKRTYYFDVKQNRKGDKYITITESKRLATNGDPSATIAFERHKIFLYKEDFDKFATAFKNAIEVAKRQDDDTDSTTGMEVSLD